MSLCDRSSEGLADFLEARKEDIARRWEERMRAMLQLERLAQGDVVDSLPEFLAALITSLRGGRAPVDAIAEAHGRQRYRLGLGISSVVVEYSMLRAITFELLREDDCPIEPEALALFMDVLATARAEALRCHAAEHEKALRAAEEKLRESETRYHLATLATSDAIWDWNIGTNQVHWSDNIYRLTVRGEGQVDPAFEWWAENIHPEERERVVGGLEAVLTSGQAHWRDEYRFRRGDGSYMFVNDRGYVVRDARGQALRMVGALQDITGRKVAEQEARRRAEFERYLIGIVSHDLRNPLNAISMGATLLRRRGGLDEPGRRSLQRILASAERATRMLRDLLDFTQARLQGALPVQPRRMDLHKLTRHVVEEVQLAHPDREILLEQAGDGLGEWDGDRLAQLITNLVNNALTYGQAHHAVRVRTQGQPDTVLLSVHNTGAPISVERISELFQPLQRGAEKGSGGTHSIGLGLYIVKHIVHAHGGCITVDSTAQAGTTFNVALPRHPPPKPGPARC